MYAHNLILLGCRKCNKLSFSRKNKSLIAVEFSLLKLIKIHRQDPNMLTKQFRQSSHICAGPPFFPLFIYLFFPVLAWPF